MADPWSQDGFRCRLEWGHRGARVAAERGDVLVVVDVLSFSTAAVTAVQHGGIVYPCAWTADPAAYAARIGVEVAVRRQDVPEKGRFSRSPEVLVCQGAFMASRDDISHLLWESGSGRELRTVAYPEDVTHATRLDAYDAVPIMDGERLVATGAE